MTDMMSNEEGYGGRGRVQGFDGGGRRLKVVLRT